MVPQEEPKGGPGGHCCPLGRLFKLSVHLRSALTNRYLGARYGDSTLVSLVLGRQRQEDNIDLLATHTHSIFWVTDVNDFTAVLTGLAILTFFFF